MKVIRKEGNCVMMISIQKMLHILFKKLVRYIWSMIK